MFVEAQVSSMKTRRTGSRSSWPSNHSCRRIRKSERSCSEACVLFFARVIMTRKEAVDRAEAEEEPLFSKAMTNVFDGRLPVRTQGFEDGVHVCVYPGRASISTQCTTPGIAPFACATRQCRSSKA